MYTPNPFQVFVQHFSDCLDTHNHAQILENFEALNSRMVEQLFKKTRLDTEKVAQYFSNLLGMTYLDLDTLDVQNIPGDLVHTTLVQQYPILPLWQKNDRIYLGISNPCHQKIIEILRFYTQKPIAVLLVDQRKLEKARQHFLSRKDLTVVSNQALHTHRTPLVDNPQANSDDVPVIQYLNQLLHTAIQHKASDIHLEPSFDQLRVRFRVDGLLHTHSLVPLHLSNRLFSRIKIMAHLDIAERRRPQSGHFTFSLSKESHTVDCRVSTCPTQYGEKFAIRLLDQTQIAFKLNKLGLNAKQYTLFLSTLQKKQGLILVTGPTGSGKTVTLYSALQALEKDILNISTAEDPIEIYLPGINQLSIQPKIGLDFEAALKTFLRQDPDVIMFGEMRDLKTAEMSIQAAQTGHLILSTIHTKNAIETITRLSNMGIPHYEIASSVTLIIAQRLARRLCDLCKEKVTLFPETTELHDFKIPEKMIAFQAKGCSNCIQGYKGRIGIFELLPVNTALSQLISKNQSTLSMIDTHAMSNFFSLQDAAFEKLKEGIISLEEIHRILAE